VGGLPFEVWTHAHTNAHRTHTSHMPLIALSHILAMPV